MSHLYKKVPSQLPPIFDATPTSLIDHANALTAEYRAVVEQIKDIGLQNATFENVILPLAQIDNKFKLSSTIIAFYRRVSPDKDLRDASNTATKILMSDAGNRICLDIYPLVEAACESLKQTDRESERMAMCMARTYVAKGAGIKSAEERLRFKEIKNKLSLLVTDFQQVLNEENGYLLVLEDRMNGVSEEILSKLEKTGKGEIKIPFKRTFFWPVLKYALDPELRRDLYLADAVKCRSNVSRFMEAMLIRHEIATILGYSNFASFAHEDLLVKTPDYVSGMLNSIISKLAPPREKELQRLKKLKLQDDISHSRENDGNFYPWDWPFYNRLGIEQQHSINLQEIAEYFPLQSTIKAVLRVFGYLFGLVFHEVEGEERNTFSETGKGTDIVWQDDVKLFSVWDDEEGGNAFVGYLYLDLHPRDGKSSQNNHITLQPGFLQPDGSRRYPVAVLVCNFLKPTSEKPSLFQQTDLRTIFHELGHAIHNLVGRTTYACFHGTSVVRDFCETIGKMFENWCWIPSLLKDISSHYKTGDKIPDHLVEKLVKSRDTYPALSKLFNVLYSRFDMAVYTLKSIDVAKEMDLSKCFGQELIRILGFDGPGEFVPFGEWANGFATTSHLMSDHAATYYSYVLTEITALDMFRSKFGSDPLNPKEGRHFRKMILEKGGSQNEAEMYAKYMGRELSMDVFDSLIY